MYIFIETTTQKLEKKKKKEGKRELSRTRTRYLWIDATAPNHYTTEADYVITGKSFLLNFFSMKLPPAR